jgi:hypothetical protein
MCSRAILLVSYLLGAFRISLSSANAAGLGDPDAVRGIVQRVDRGDDAALWELARFDASSIGPVLEIYALDRSTNAARAQAAIDILRSLPEFDKYFRQRLKNIGEADSTERDRLFKVLGLIGTEKAASLVSPYLFDESPPPASAGDVITMRTNWIAAYALGNMHFGDNPAGSTYPEVYQDTDIRKWQKWAVEHGFVRAAGEPPHSSTSARPSSPAPLPPASGNPVYPNVGSKRAVPATQEPPAESYPVVLTVCGAICALLSIGALIHFWHRRTRRNRPA